MQLPDESKDDVDIHEKTTKRHSRQDELDDPEDNGHKDDERSVASIHSAQTVTIRIPSYYTSSNTYGNFNFLHDDKREDDLVSIGSKAQMELNEIVAKHENLNDTTVDDDDEDDDHSECGISWCAHDSFVSQSFKEILRSFSAEEEQPLSLSAAEPPQILFMETPPRPNPKTNCADQMESQPKQQEKKQKQNEDDDEKLFHEHSHKQMFDQVLLQLVMRCAREYTQPTSSPLLFTHKRTFDRVLEELFSETQKKNSILSLAGNGKEPESQEEEFFSLVNILTSHEDEKEGTLKDEEGADHRIQMDLNKVDSSANSPAPLKVSELRDLWSSSAYQTPELVRAPLQLEHTDVSTPEDHPVDDDDIRSVSSLDEVKFIMDKTHLRESSATLPSKICTNSLSSILILARLLVVFFLLILGGGMVLARDLWFPNKSPSMSTHNHEDQEFLALRLMVIEYETGV
jgi:hypothetical protein